MISTYVLIACVLGLGVALFFVRSGVVARIEAFDDALQDVRGIAEQADRASRKLAASQNPDRSGVRSVG